MRRLNKYITDSGYCSRREADRYITQGRVVVNGRVAALGDMVGDTDTVEVDGEKVGRRKKAPVYIACNKPVGVTCTSERSDKTNIIDFLGYKERIFPVGRLDKDSEGLILLTNDGDIVNKILRAGNNNPKEYVVTVDKPITPEFLDRMAAGVRILGVTTKPCHIYQKKESTFIIHLTQGLNRQIRRMCQTLGYKVIKLKRVKVLNISLGNLEPGRWRHLTPEEACEMHALLAESSGTEEASNEKKAAKAKKYTGAKSQGRVNRMSRETNGTSVRGKAPAKDLQDAVKGRMTKGNGRTTVGAKTANGSQATPGAAKAVSGGTTAVSDKTHGTEASGKGRGSSRYKKSGTYSDYRRKTKSAKSGRDR